LLSDPLSLPNIEMEAMYSYADTLFAHTGCANENCLRAKNASTLIAAQKDMIHITIENVIQAVLPNGPVVDGTLIPMRWEKALLTGNWNKVPLIIGTTAEEGRLFINEAIKGNLGSVLYSSVLGLLFRLSALKVGNKYPPIPFSDNKDLFGKLITDYLFACPSRYLMQLLQPQNPVIYNYVFTETISYNGWGPDFQYCYGHSCHASDLVFEFDPVPGKYWNFTAKEKFVSQNMIRYLANFMRSSDPNVGLPVSEKWPRWTNQTKQSIFFQANMNVSGFYKDDICNFWDKLGYGFGVRNISKSALR